ncbi:pollen-specific leucine-rich repeat extensin-like protein 4 [Iris pallida]|uniref:Pollen-specific leucine-rich repeat extensin-like protein 4 n=1 Tax=Iris pallida TaxID=29817 RepID=A0AAX6FJM2_IRIPA|nr:pollen-specific leucine-rich repeat extensin-like protein 4 [Iris pallida]
MERTRTHGSGHDRYGDFCDGYTDTIGHGDGNGGGFRSCDVGGGGRGRRRKGTEASTVGVLHKCDEYGNRRPWFCLEKEGGKITLLYIGGGSSRLLLR